MVLFHSYVKLPEGSPLKLCPLKCWMDMDGGSPSRQQKISPDVVTGAMEKYGLNLAPRQRRRGQQRRPSESLSLTECPLAWLMKLQMKFQFDHLHIKPKILFDEEFLMLETQVHSRRTEKTWL